MRNSKLSPNELFRKIGITIHYRRGVAFLPNVIRPTILQKGYNYPIKKNIPKIAIFSLFGNLIIPLFLSFVNRIGEKTAFMYKIHNK